VGKKLISFLEVPSIDYLCNPFWSQKEVVAWLIFPCMLELAQGKEFETDQ